MKVSNTAFSLLLVLIMVGLAIYLFFFPPAGFEDDFAYRISIPFLMIAAAFGLLENLRTRAHISQLLGALRSMLKRSGKEATPEVKAEAVEILLESLRSDDARVRETAARQLGKLTGEAFGEDVDAWEDWWSANQRAFRRGGQA